MPIRLIIFFGVLISLSPTRQWALTPPYRTDTIKIAQQSSTELSAKKIKKRLRKKSKGKGLLWGGVLLGLGLVLMIIGFAIKSGSWLYILSGGLLLLGAVLFVAAIVKILSS